MTPLYARRNQTSDRYFPLASCPPNTIVSDAPVLDPPIRASGYVTAAAPLRGLGNGETELGSPAGKILAQDPVSMSRTAYRKSLAFATVKDTLWRATYDFAIR